MKNSPQILLVVIVFFLVICGCNNRQTDTQKLKNKIDELTIRKDTNGVKINVQYIPVQLKIDRMSRNRIMNKEDSSNASSFDDFDVKVYKNYWKPGKDTVEYMNFKIGEDFLLVMNNTDTIHNSICERLVTGSFDMSEFLISFETGINKEKLEKKWQLIYNDHVFGTGQLIFDIPVEKIKNITGK